MRENIARRISVLHEIRDGLNMQDNPTLQNIEDVLIEIRRGDRSFYGQDSGPSLDFSNLSKDDIELFYYTLFMQKHKGIKMFNTMDSEFILKLGLALQKRDFKKDQIIYTRDEPAANMYILREGCVTFMLQRFDEIPFMKVNSGFFGEYELLFNCNRLYTCRACTDVTLYYVNAEHFKDIFLRRGDHKFVKELNCFSSDRMNIFNQTHSKFELKIKKELQSKESFKKVKSLFDAAFRKIRFGGVFRKESKDKGVMRMRNAIRPSLLGQRALINIVPPEDSSKRDSVSSRKKSMVSDFDSKPNNQAHINEGLLPVPNKVPSRRGSTGGGSTSGKTLKTSSGAKPLKTKRGSISSPTRHPRGSISSPTRPNRNSVANLVIPKIIIEQAEESKGASAKTPISSHRSSDQEG